MLIALLWLVAVVAAPAQAALPSQAKPAPLPAPAPPPPPKAYVLVDANTGAVLAASGDRVPRPPASLTKVVTALAASATLPHDGTIAISPRAEAQPANKIDAKAGQVWPINDAMHIMLMQSANDLALAFAEAVGGSAEGFQEVLARTGAAVGMQDPQTWRDPAGLDDEASLGGGNLVSARDLAIAGRAMIADPWLSPISAKPRYRFTAPSGVVHDALNHNKLVLGRYPGAIGGKTGFTKKSGNSLLAAAQRDGRTMVAVVMDSKDTYGFTSALFDRGFGTPVAAQGKLERLPPLRLPTAAKIRPPTVAPVAPVTTLGPTADPAPASPLVTTPLDVAPAEPASADPLAAVEGRGGTDLPLLAGGAAVAVAALVGIGRGQARRRRRSGYYRVPTRRPAP